MEIVISGEDKAVIEFISLIKNEVPAGGFVLSVDLEDCDNNFGKQFEIIESSELDLSSEIPVFLPDIGICDDCMREMLDQNDRRYRYPLISCAVCGPRMSILNRLPYDRNTTTMEAFHMCPKCQMEYGAGRRHYAQTISCHDCGPQMIFRDSIHECAPGEESVKQAIELLRSGKIIGLKGISGYQLVCRPTEESAGRLRSIKGRENKPFAIMFSTVEDIRAYANVTELEKELLTSSARPIVLVERSGSSDFPEEVIKKSRYIGAFLPSAGIHRLLTDELGPLIVTSANRSDEPMIIDDEYFCKTFMNPDAEDSIRADGVLYHTRNINMPQDDSVMFVIDVNGTEYPQFIRRARGFAPLPVNVPNKELDTESSKSVLALGGDLKSTFAFGKKEKIMPSQYIGDLEDLECMKSYERLLEDYQRIFDFTPDLVVNDLHPAYISTAFSKKLQKEQELKSLGLQHHFAHTYSVMAENGLDSTIGVSFDGTGYGIDGKIWGGEFVFCQKSTQKRMGHLSYIKLAGGNKAPKEAKKISLCYLADSERQGLVDSKAFTDNDKDYPLIRAALDNNINTFDTSSMGRLFDGVSSLLGICNYNSYEGECAIMLESAAWDFYNVFGPDGSYPVLHFDIESKEDAFTADQTALFAEIAKQKSEGIYDEKAISYGFHMAVKELIISGVDIISHPCNEINVCLSGGVFNNRLLLKTAAEALLKKGYKVYWNNKVPLGDGGLSTGQAYYGLLLG